MYDHEVRSQKARAVGAVFAFTVLSAFALAACGSDAAPAPTSLAIDAGTPRRDAGANYPGDLVPDAGVDSPDATSSDAAADAKMGDAATRCAPTTSCPTGQRDLGTLSGDKASAPLTATGVGNTWLNVRVTEDDSSVTSAVDLKLKVTLTSPPLENYDVVIYLASSSQVGAFECQTVRAQSTSVSQTDQLAVSWPDNHPAGGQDDSKNVTVEVRHASGPCAPGAEWSLKVEGNAL